MAKQQKTKAFSIEIMIDGKKKKITQTGIKTSALRKILKYYKGMEEIAEAEKNGEQVDELGIIDGMIILLSEIFTDPRVDFEAIENSIDADELANTLEKVLHDAMGVDDAKKA